MPTWKWGCANMARIVEKVRRPWSAVNFIELKRRAVAFGAAWRHVKRRSDMFLPGKKSCAPDSLHTYISLGKVDDLKWKK